MISSLSQQLSQLKGQNIKEKVVQPSILYSSQKSGTYDLDHIFYLASQGLSKLTQIDSRFTEYQTTLLSLQQKGLTRSLLTTADNQKINNELSQILLLLSRYFSYEPTHQVIEYLLRNYRVHEHLPNELAIYFLQYHTTQIYTRLLQNIIDQHREKNDFLSFLYKPISRGEVIQREALVRQIKADYRLLSSLLQYIADYLRQPASSSNDIFYDVAIDSLTEEEIRKIKGKQSNPLAFLYMILFEVGKLKISNSYLESIRGPIGNIIGLCVEFRTEESLALVYLLLHEQLISSHCQWLAQNQITQVAAFLLKQIENQEYNNLNNYQNCLFLLYEVGILNSAHNSVKLCEYLEHLEQNNQILKSPLLLFQIINSFLIQNTTLSQKILNILLKKIAQVLNGPYKFALIEEIIGSLQKSKNSSFSEFILDLIHPYVADQQKYAHLFPNLVASRVTYKNVEDLLHKNDQITKLSAGQILKMVDDILRLLNDRKQQVNLVKLLNQLISNSNCPQSQIFNYHRYLQLMSNLIVNDQLIPAIIGVTKYTLEQQPIFQQSIILIFISSMRNFIEEPDIQKFICSFYQLSSYDEIIAHIKENKEVESFLNSQENDSEVIFNCKLMICNWYLEDNKLNQIARVKIKQIFSTNAQFSNDVVESLFQNIINLHQKSNSQDNELIILLFEIEHPQALKKLKSYFLEDSKQSIISIFFEAITKVVNDIILAKMILIIQQLLKRLELVNNNFMALWSTFVIHGLIYFNQMTEITKEVFFQICSSFKLYLKKQESQTLEFFTLPLKKKKKITIHKNVFKNLISVIIKNKNEIVNKQQQFLKLLALNQLQSFSNFTELIIQNSSSYQNFDVIKQMISNAAKVFEIKQPTDDILKSVQKFCESQLIQEENPRRFELLKSYFQNPSESFLESLVDKLPQNKEIGEFLNSLLVEKKFEQFPKKFKTDVLIYLSNANIQNRNILSDENIEHGDLMKKFIVSLNGQLIARHQYLSGLLQSNVQFVEESLISQLLGNILVESHSIISICSFLKVYIDYSKETKLPICTYLVKLLVTYLTNIETIDLSDPVVYQNVSQIIGLLSYMTQLKCRKVAYQSCKEIIENKEIKKVLSLENTLIMVKLITESLVKFNNSFFNETSRFAYFMTIQLALLNALLLQKNITSNNYIIFHHFNAYSEKNLWVLIYLIQKFEFNNQLTNIILSQTMIYNEQVKINWMSALCESLTVMQMKLLKQQNMGKDKEYKYTTHLVEKIMQQVDSTVIKSVRSGMDIETNVGGQIKQYQLKRQFFYTLNTISQIVESIKNYLISQTQLVNQETYIISVIKNTNRIEKYFLGLKIGNYARKLKETLLQYLNLKVIFSLLKKTLISEKSIFRILLASLNNLFSSETIKLKRSHHKEVVDFIESVALDILSEDTPLSTLEGLLITINYFFTIPTILKQVQSDENLSNEFFSRMFNLLKSEKMNCKAKSYILNIFGLATKSNYYPYIEQMSTLIEITLSLLVEQADDTQKINFENASLKKQLEINLQISTNSFIEKDQEVKLVLIECMNNLVYSFKSLISKKDIANIVLVYLSNDLKLDIICECIEVRIILTLLSDLVSRAQKISYLTVQNLAKFYQTVFENCMEEDVDINFMELTKLTLLLLDYSRKKFIDQEIEESIFVSDETENIVIETLITLITKMNDHQLKKSFNIILMWSKEKIQNPGYNYQNFRKIVLFKTVRQYFTKYFAYLFDMMVNELSSFNQQFQQQPKKTGYKNV